jgi:hypothetical protein
VEDAMHATSDPVLDSDISLQRAFTQLNGSPAEHLLVRMNPSGWSFISRSDLGRMIREGKGEMTLRSVLPIRQLPHLHPDHRLEIALRYVDQWPLVPVLSRADNRKLEGVISKPNVLRAYSALEDEL